MALTRGGQHKGRELTPSQVKAFVERVLRGQGLITYTGHVKDRMRQREFTSQDIQYLLETGTYTKGFWEAQAQNHEANVTGWDLNGEELELSLALSLDQNCVIVVTGKRPRQ